MPQLRSCYFCGTVGDSLREYEVVPERLVSPGEAHSAVLCSTCHEKLRRVLEPLVDAAESSPDAPGRDLSAIGEVTFESAEGTDGQDDTGDPTPEVEVTDDETEASVADDDAGTDDAAAADADTGDATADDAGTDDADVPDGYYKVLRLLQNREFPMERADLTALVTGAYDVSEPQCERILETAIDRGVLVEDGSTLDIGRH